MLCVMLQTKQKQYMILLKYLLKVYKFHKGEENIFL